MRLLLSHPDWIRMTGQELARRAQSRQRQMINEILITSRFKFGQNAVLIFLMLTLSSFMDYAHASCRCVCSGGIVRLACSGSPKFIPFCAPQVCAQTRKSIIPKNKRTYPPPLKMKMSDCQQRHVLNPRTNKMVWRTICRSEHSF